MKRQRNLQNIYVFVGIYFFAIVCCCHEQTKLSDLQSIFSNFPLDKRKLNSPDQTFSRNNAFSAQSNCSDCESEKFLVETVPNEMIVTFDGYYSKEERKEYINYALVRCGFNSSLWGLVPRHNIAQLFPSDFDVLQFHPSINMKVYTLVTSV